jgi:hypothetical protein
LFSTVNPGKFLDSTLFRPRSLPSRFLPIHPIIRIYLVYTVTKPYNRIPSQLNIHFVIYIIVFVIVFVIVVMCLRCVHYV